MNLTPAAIHKQLKQLEDELQSPLYEKHDGKLQLTQPARIMLPHFEEMLSQYRNALSALEEWKGLRRGEIRIGAGPGLASFLLPPVLKKFHHKWPNVDADVETGNSAQLINALENRDLDVALVMARESPEEVSLRTVMELRFEIVLVSCLAGLPKKCSLHQLSSFPFLLYRRGARIENLIEEYFASHHFSPNVIMRSDFSEALKAMVQSGMGISMLPSFAVQGEISSGKVRQIRLTEPPLMSSYRVLLRKTDFVLPAVSAFISIIQETTKGVHQRVRRTLTEVKQE
jgi:DNA-binding transcriptional LysR family regulator